METEWIDLKGLDENGRKDAYERAGRIIREGGLVAFPTETVYGLGGDALSPGACIRIYQAKGRPSDNPLIAHIADLDQVPELARDIPDEAWTLMKTFWPGPLTVILNKRSHVPDEATGGLSTVAIRMPSHPAARELIRAADRPIAAPSANRSGRPSPTLAVHVYEDLKGRIPMILDGGPVEIGIESTIIDMTSESPLILRPGYISPLDLKKALGTEIGIDPAVDGKADQTDIVAKAPGMKYRHYAPKGDLLVVEGPGEAVVLKINALSEIDCEKGRKVGVIATRETKDLYKADFVRSIGSRDHPETVAAGLYRILREFDDLSCDRIYSESFFGEGLGNAVMNRLLKAAGHRIITV